MGPHPAVAAVRSAVRAVLDDLSARVVRSSPADEARKSGQLGLRRVLVACSGGADSLALAAATAFEAPRAGVAAGLITVDHGLQPGSAERAERVAALGYELGFDPVVAVRVEVCGPGGPEGAAREARYAALAAAADPAGAHVLLGHTLDDQAETVLLGLGRGSGPRSIAGMAVVAGRYRRPLLGLRRETTVAACAALGLDAWDDPHNADPAFRRVRVRHEVLPLLEDVLHGGVAEALARTADLLRDDLAALDAWAAQFLADQQRVSAAQRREASVDHGEVVVDHGRVAGDQGGLGVDALVALPRAVRTRVLRAWAGGSLSAERTAALDALVTGWHGQGPVQLPGGAAVRRTSGRLVLYPSAQE